MKREFCYNVSHNVPQCHKLFTGHHGYSIFLYPNDDDDVGIAKNLKPRISSGLQKIPFQLLINTMKFRILLTNHY